MLQTQTVSPELLELLKSISTTEIFSEYILVGGTALALQIGHRNSIDLDFFYNKPIDENLFIETLSQFGDIKKIGGSENVLVLSINNIKVDFVNHKYPFIDKPIEINGIKMASKKDISAMKLNAIEGRGTKKDFIDLYFLMNDFSLPEMIDFYRQKYPNHSDFMMLKSLTYFEDAEIMPTPKMFKTFDWEQCKTTILREFIKLNI
ncbi:MAG: nucleotidyl transferase AbiEii/AbiGii toxin family protein [Bergeyella zoohelcum]|nr:nucleotidyl transferase AbiEii/AbiGii toxin family protein [Bergeyella zoohelcum]